MATDERNRILGMVEAGQISATQAAQLLDTLVMQQSQTNQRIERAERLQSHTIRIWITDMTTRRQKIKLTATLPVYLLSVSLRMISLSDGAASFSARTTSGGIGAAPSA